MNSTVTSKGQVTIPKRVRDELHLQTGDRVEFALDPDGTVRLAAATGSVRDLKGILPKPDQAVSLEAMDRAIAKGAARS